MPLTAIQLEAVYKPIQSALERVQQKISQQFNTSDPQLSELLSSLSQQQGKLLRPAMVLLCGQLTADISDEHIDYAAMVELIHMASLLHDDVIDQGCLRRGQPSANAIWGNTVAVLLGDYLLSRAFALGTFSNCNGAAEILAQTSQTLCTGELKQNLLKGRWDLSEPDYFSIIEAKTAALFSCSCRLGAIASKTSIQKTETLQDFGHRFGLAFQIADDIRDILSTEDFEGKTLGTDLQEEKLTLPLIHWINHDSERKEACIEQLKTLKDVHYLIEQLKQSGSINYAAEQAQSHMDKAIELMDSFSACPTKDGLLLLANAIVSDLE